MIFELNESAKRRLERLEDLKTGQIVVTFEDGTKRKMRPLDLLDTIFFSTHNAPVDADKEAFSWLCGAALEVSRIGRG